MSTRIVRRSKCRIGVYSLVMLLVVGTATHFVFFCLKECKYLTADGSKHRNTINKTLTVHFIETSLNPRISGRQCCAIESSARNHPSQSVIMIWLRKKLTLNDICPGLAQLGDIKTRLYAVEDLLINSPLLIWLARIEAHKSGRFLSRFPLIHFGDALRLALLHAHGGVYLDLDIIITSKNALYELSSKASLGREAPESLGNSFLAFPKGHSFLRDAMKEFANTFRGDLWAFNGPRLLERVIRRWGCSPESAVSCRDISIFNHNAFYPISYQNWPLLFSDSPNDIRTLSFGEKPKDATLGVHLWNSASSNATVSKGSPLYRIALRNCPNTLQRGRPL